MADSMIDLPSARPLLPVLLQAGFGHEIATVASKLYQQRAEELKRRTETTLIAAWKKITSLPGASASALDPLTRKDISNLTEVYLRCLEEWKEEMVQLLRQASNIPPKPVPQKNSRPFNHEYLPLLEHFFDENPFPTHGDKVFLAKKSNMQYRQIHVWFQNRRNRTKRGVKPTMKKQGATRPLDKLCERMKDYVVKPVSQIVPPSQVSSPAVDEQLRTVQSNAPKHDFTSSPPPHAFPSPYLPACANPCKSSPVSFGKPEWRRVPFSKPPLSIPVSIDDLVVKFSQLNVRGNMRSKGSLRQRSQAATAAITIIPPSAPHPALIVQRYPKSTYIPMDYLLVRASNTRLHAFQCTNPSSPPATLTPDQVPPCRSEPFTKWKTARLPRRFPGQKQNNKRDTAPSECSPTSSLSSAFSASSKSRKCPLSSVSPLRSPENMA